MHYRTKFHQNRSFDCRDIAFITFFNMGAVPILDFWNINFWTAVEVRRPICTTMQNFFKIGQTFFVHFSLTPLRSWTWLNRQKANKMTFPTISCLYGNIVNFSQTSRIHFSANNTSFRPFKPMDWVRGHTHTQTDTQKWKQYIRRTWRV